MEIYGKEVPFKISSVKCAAALERALDEMGEAEEKIQKLPTDRCSDVLMAMIEMFRSFFRTATGEDPLSDCDDYEEAQEAYYKFLDDVKAQKSKVFAPYSPNRIK